MRKLQLEEVRKRLESYSNPAVTDELYEFGQSMVSDVIERHNRLESKAAMLAAYSIGMITLLTSTYSNWFNRGISAGIFVTIVAAFVAVVLCVLSLKLEQFKGSSQADWIQHNALHDRETLRKFHVLTMWVVVASHDAVNERRATNIAWAQLALLIATLFLVGSIAYAVVIS